PPAPPVPAPAPTPTRLDTPRPGRPRARRPLLVAAAALLAAGALTALALSLRTSDGGTKDDQRAVGAHGGSTAPPVSPAPTPSATPTPTPTGAAPAPAPSGSSSAPLGDGSGGRWIAQLHSEPLTAGTAVRDQRLARVRESVPEAVAVRSDDYASLRPGYWVIYAPGPFGDGRSALAFCAERGRTSANACVGRYLSTSPADFALQCRPPVTSPAGRCTRGT
ncbi:serine/threonine protein kinase, partial [Streptomyces cinereospinus]